MALKQLTVFVENRQGTLVNVTDTLAAHDVNIRALSIAETEGYGILRLIVDNEKKAEAVLTEAGYLMKMPLKRLSMNMRHSGYARIRIIFLSLTGKQRSI